MEAGSVAQQIVQGLGWGITKLNSLFVTLSGLLADKFGFQPESTFLILLAGASFFIANSITDKRDLVKTIVIAAIIFAIIFTGGKGI